MPAWLDTLLARGTEAQAAKVKEPTSTPAPTRSQPARVYQAPRVPDQPQPRPEIKSVYFQTSAPNPDTGHPGSVEVGFYSVSGDVLTLHDESGKQTGRHDLKPGEDPRQTAGRLTKAAWSNRVGQSDFNRPIHYRRSGYA